MHGLGPSTTLCQSPCGSRHRCRSGGRSAPALRTGPSSSVRPSSNANRHTGQTSPSPASPRGGIAERSYGGFGPSKRHTVPSIGGSFRADFWASPTELCSSGMSIGTRDFGAGQRWSCSTARSSVSRSAAGRSCTAWRSRPDPMVSAWNDVASGLGVDGGISCSSERSPVTRWRFRRTFDWPGLGTTRSRPSDSSGSNAQRGPVRVDAGRESGSSGAPQAQPESSLLSEETTNGIATSAVPVHRVSLVRGGVMAPRALAWRAMGAYRLVKDESECCDVSLAPETRPEARALRRRARSGWSLQSRSSVGQRGGR